MPERDTKGRFVKGNTGGPGRPSRKAEAEYLNLTASKVPLDQWQHVVAKALDDALAGDKHARRWLSDHLIGRPSTPSLVAGIDSALFESFVNALRASNHEPAEVIMSVVTQLNQDKDSKWNEYRHHSG